MMPSPHALQTVYLKHNASLMGKISWPVFLLLLLFEQKTGEFHLSLAAN